MNPNLSPKAQKDYEFVQKALNGDQSAFGALLDNYRESVYFLLLKIVKNPIEAEDLAIESFDKAFKNLESYTPSHAFSTWLFRIATNNGIDFIRKKKLSTFSLDQQIYNEKGDHFSLSIKSDTLDPEKEVINEQSKAQIREFVEKLHPRYKKLIHLRYFEELSYEEISQMLQLPEGTIKSQLFRARNLLYNIIKDENHDL